MHNVCGDALVAMQSAQQYKIYRNFFAKIAKDQILRASESTLNSLKFCASLKNGTMTSNLVKGKHLCMEQFKSLFGLCRIPKEGEGDKDVVDEDS